jgi:hypothetical protein
MVASTSASSAAPETRRFIAYSFVPAVPAGRLERLAGHRPGV